MLTTKHKNKPLANGFITTDSCVVVVAYGHFVVVVLP